MKIVGLGDSLTAGHPGFLSPIEAPPEGDGDPRSQYAYWMQELRPSWRVLNRGIGGERTDQILKRYERDAREERPDCVILLAGTNDLYQGHPVSWAQRHLTQLYENALADRFLAVACSIPPLSGATPRFQGRMRELNSWIAQTAREYGLSFCDLYPLMEDPKRPGVLRYGDDGVHPDAAGYRVMGEALVGAVEKMISDGRR